MLLALAAAVRAADDEIEEEARLRYASAFERELEGKERVKILESVAAEYGDTTWADDSLWVLAEMARRGGYREQAMEFRKRLLEVETPPELEPFTRRQRIYVKSRARSVSILLRYTGHHYASEGETVLVFNPVPMLVAEDLAIDYEHNGEHELALEQYRRALSLAPRGGFFADLYERRMKQTEEKIKEVEEAEEREGAADPEEETGQLQEDEEREQSARDDEASTEENETHEPPEPTDE